MKRTVTLGLLILVAASAAEAQAKPLIVVDGVVQWDRSDPGAQEYRVFRGMGTSPAPDDPFAQYFFPPEFVMAHQTEINLTDRQRTAIAEAVKDATGKFIDAQFKLSAAGEKLKLVIQGPTVDEAKTLEQIDQVLSLEREVKRAQIALAIRIKNLLTEQQQAQLTKIRKQTPGEE